MSRKAALRRNSSSRQASGRAFQYSMMRRLNCRPQRDLSLLVKEGFDLVGFSGGKGLHGPQASRACYSDVPYLIEAAQQNNNPYAEHNRSYGEGGVMKSMTGLLCCCRGLR